MLFIRFTRALFNDEFVHVIIREQLDGQFLTAGLLISEWPLSLRCHSVRLEVGANGP